MNAADAAAITQDTSATAAAHGAQDVLVHAAGTEAAAEAAAEAGDDADAAAGGATKVGVVHITEDDNGMETNTVTVEDASDLLFQQQASTSGLGLAPGPPNVEVEIEDGQTAAISAANSQIWEMDPEVLMPQVSQKLFEHFSLWDLLLQKTKMIDDETHPIECIFEETERVLLELKIFIEACMKPIPKRQWGKNKKLADGIKVSELLSTALCLKAGMWKRKEWQDIEYQCPLQLNELFQDKTFRPCRKRNSKAYPDDGRVRPAPRFQNIRVKEEIFDEDIFPDSNVKFNDDYFDAEDMNTIGPMSFYDSDADSHKRGHGRQVASSKGLEKESKLKSSKPKGTGSRKPKEINRIKFAPKEEDRRFFCTFPGCEQSEMSFPSKGEVAQHFDAAHVKEHNKILPCFVCDEKFAISLLRGQHMVSSHEKGYGCAKCDKKFWRQNDAEEHVMKAHDPNEVKENVDPSCVCYKCGRKFNSSVNVCAHESKCDGLFNRQPKFHKLHGEYVCTETGCTVKRGFTSEYGLRNHFYDHHLHDDEKAFNCQQCGRKFGMRSMLNKHVAASHEKKHICDYCGRGFGSKFKLKTHTYTHTGEKPYECDKCNYRAAKQYNLDQHKVKQHRDFGGRNHHCDLCRKKFVSIGRARMHMKQVHGTDGDSADIQDGQIIVAPQDQVATTATVMQAQPTVGAQVAQDSTTQYIIQGTPVMHNMNMPIVYMEQEAAVEYIQTELGRIEGIRHQ